MYLPLWAKPNCKVLRDYTEEIISGGVKGTVHWVEYKDPKGKVQNQVRKVEWYE